MIIWKNANQILKRPRKALPWFFTVLHGAPRGKAPRGEMLQGVLNLNSPTFFVCLRGAPWKPRESTVRPHERFLWFARKKIIHRTSWSLEALWFTVDRFSRCPAERFPRCSVEIFPWCRKISTVSRRKISTVFHGFCGQFIPWVFKVFHVFVRFPVAFRGVFHGVKRSVTFPSWLWKVYSLEIPTICLKKGNLK